MTKPKYIGDSINEICDLYDLRLGYIKYDLDHPTVVIGREKEVERVLKLVEEDDIKGES